MVKSINLQHLPCLNQPDNIVKLNKYLSTHTDAMPHGIAIATGCSLDNSMQLLMLLYYLNLSDAYLAIYHQLSTHPNVVAELRPIKEGMPNFPFICEVCEKEVMTSSELSYNFIFKFKDSLEFISVNEHE